MLVCVIHALDASVCVYIVSVCVYIVLVCIYTVCARALTGQYVYTLYVSSIDGVVTICRSDTFAGLFWKKAVQKYDSFP